MHSSRFLFFFFQSGPLILYYWAAKRIFFNNLNVLDRDLKSYFKHILFYNICMLIFKEIFPKLSFQEIMRFHSGGSFPALLHSTWKEVLQKERMTRDRERKERNWLTPLRKANPIPLLPHPGNISGSRLLKCHPTEESRECFPWSISPYTHRYWQ